MPTTDTKPLATDCDIPTTSFGRTLLPLWRLDPETCFLNHGSFGATPIPVLEAQDQWRLRMERQPVRFMVDDLAPALRAAAAALARFVGADGAQLAFTTNATEAVNAVLGSIDWRPDDEILLANHAYPAVRNTALHLAARHRLRVVEAEIPFPIDAPARLNDAYLAACSPRTRLAIVDHVFSPLAIVAAVSEIVPRLRERGVRVLVDGAHAPGMLPLDLDQLGADWYVGNVHKWMFAAKGCAFLHVREPARDPLHPAIVSNFHGQAFPAEFDWIGTRDYSAWLSVTAALAFLEGLGVERYRAHCRQLATRAASLLADRWGVQLPAPPELSAAMVTVPIPGPGGDDSDPRELRRRLLEDFSIEVPVLHFGGRDWVRISAQVYNDLADYAVLADAILALRRR